MGRILLYSSGIIAEKKPTGGELRFLELARHLARRPDAELCCADDEDALKPLCLHAGIHLKTPAPGRHILPAEARILLSNFSTLRRIKSRDFSDVIVFDVPPATGLVLAGVRNLTLMIRKDMIGYERVKSNHAGMKKRLVIGYQWVCEAICLHAAKRVICQCEYDRDTILRRHALQRGKLSPKFRVQINNCNPAWIVKRAEVNPTYSSGDEVNSTDSSGENGKFRVCFIGGFDDLRKGQDIFLQAAQNLTQRYREMEFILVGGGKKLDAYRSEYESGQIRFTGRLDNPVEIMKACDLLVVPSLADSCPNTVMEALYCGVPVIGSRAGGIPEILENENALFTPDSQTLTEKLEQCIGDSEFLPALRTQQAARRDALSFDWAETMMGIILEEDISE